MNELISVIVPVYNVEDYLSECIDSIIEQTYKNLEIILVDDGSQDNSSMICDKYAQLDKRIHVIHKSNAGLSEARNDGIERASGNFLAFVDSDDSIVADMYEILYNLIQKNNVKISCCAYHRGTIKETLSEREDVLSAKEVFNEFSNCGKIEQHACNKLYSAKLFENVRYPAGKAYEDIYTTYRLIAQVDRIAFTSAQKYFYRFNPKSISNSRFKISDLDLIDGSEEFLMFLQKKYPELVKYQKSAITRHVIALLRKIMECNEEYVEQRIYLEGKLNGNMLPYLLTRYKWSSKLFGVAVSFNFNLTKKIYIMLSNGGRKSD